MDSITALLDRLSFLATMPAVAGVFLALGLLLLTRNWSAQTAGMVVMYFFVALLHTRVIRPEVALIKVLIGWLISLTLYVTGRYTAEHGEPGPARPMCKGARDWLPPIADDIPLRVLVLLAALVIAYAGTVHFPLPQVPDYVGLACYLLAAAGLLLAGMAEEPLQVGMGLLAFLAGFDLFFGALEPSLAVAGLLGTGEFLIALAVSFLGVTHAVRQEGV